MDDHSEKSYVKKRAYLTSSLVLDVKCQNLVFSFLIVIYITVHHVWTQVHVLPQKYIYICNNSTRHFFKIVISNLKNLQRTFKNKKCKKVHTNRIITRWKRQWIYLKERWKSHKIVLNRFRMYKLKLVLKI